MGRPFSIFGHIPLAHRAFAVLCFLGLCVIALMTPGCLTIASIHVDGQRGRTYVVPFGGVAIERTPSDAVGVRQVSFGLWRTGQSFGLGLVSSSFMAVKGGDDDVGILSADPLTAFSRTRYARPLPLHFKETFNESPMPTFGGDRP